MTRRQKLHLLRTVVGKDYFFKHCFVKIAQEFVEDLLPSEVSEYIYRLPTKKNHKKIREMMSTPITNERAKYTYSILRNVFKELLERRISHVPANSEYWANIGSVRYLNERFTDRRHELIEEDGKTFIITK